MSGYVVDPTLLRLALEKRTDPGQVEPLEQLIAMAEELDELERSFPARVRAARVSAGVPVETLSRSARDRIDVSDRAAARVYQLLHRQCRRSADATEVVRHLTDVARDDAEWWDEMGEAAEDDPTRTIVSEMARAKQAVVRAMETFLERFPK